MVETITNNNIKPKILQLLPALESGGVEQITISTSNIIAQHNWEQAVASNGGTLVEQLPEGCKHYKLPLKHKSVLNFLWAGYKLHKLILTEQFNILHVRSRFPAWVAWLAISILKRRGYTCPKVISTVHGAHKNSWYKRWYNRIAIQADVITTVSKFMSRYIKWAWNPSTKVEVIYDAIDLTHFTPKKTTTEECSIPLSSSRPVILLPGRISKNKGGELLLRAFAGSKARTSHQLLFVGKIESPEYHQYLLKLARKLRVSAVTTIVGAQKDLAPIYNIAELVVVPSLTQEAFGLVTAEAMAMECPVIATTLGASRELITPGVTGWLVAPKVDKLAKTIDHVIHLPAEEINKVGRQARKYISQNFDPVTTAKKWVKLYKETL